MGNFFNRLKRVKLHEVVDAWKLPVAAVCVPFFKIRHKDLWIICEDANEARDNGYWLFKYIRENEPNQECVYAINKTSPDISKVAKIGKTVEYGSLMHWILYLVATKKISSQKAGNPNAALFYFLEVYEILKDKRVFLQHGVIKDDLTWLHYDVTKMNRFICGAYPEFKYVDEVYGYPKGNVRYTGLCRFDGLHDFKADKRLILIMPTWREWIADEDERLEKYEGTRVISATNYFMSWVEFIKSNQLKRMAKEYNVHFIFFPHRNMQKYLQFFPESNEYIEIADGNKYDVQMLLKKASMMVTDYSSVYFDMIYMKKPITFYQFDYENFRKGQYKEGYFKYNDNPFGKSCKTLEEVMEEIECIIKNNFNVSEAYLQEHHNYFKLYDTNNCKRVYEVIKEL